MAKHAPMNPSKIPLFVQTNAVSPIEMAPLNAWTEYVMGSNVLKICNGAGINSSGNVPALVVNCNIRMRIATKRPASLKIDTNICTIAMNV